VLKEIALLGEALDGARNVVQMHWGGGTPNFLRSGEMADLAQAVGRTFRLDPKGEYSIEIDPRWVQPETIPFVADLGFNRISLGVQSWDDQLLRGLGREHDAAQAETSFQIFRDAGFENISIDLMFGIPGQTIDHWKASLEKTISLQPEHISCYCLTYEEDTEFLARFQRGEFALNDEMEARFLELAMTTLEKAGYEQYEISNYARRGFRSEHNRAYWRGADYIGIGPSAFSTRGLERWQNVANHNEYARRLFANESPVVSIEKLTPAMKRTEHIALGLRTREGIGVHTIGQNQADRLISDGLLSRQENRFALTRAGKLLADSVAEELL
jgi:oxygen-independent coproporphyrinogen-3 oxidase